MENDKEIKTDFIFIRADRCYYKVSLSDIYYIEAQKDNIAINTATDVLITNVSMKLVEERLPQSDFVRIHKSFIVRLDKICYIRYPDLMVEGKNKLIQVGLKYKKNLFGRMNIL